MYVPRLIEADVKSSLTNNKILIVMGARQVGKTTLLKKVISERGGVLLNLDIEVDKQKLISASKLAPFESIKYLSAEKILVIDEAHKFSDSASIVKGWFDAGVGTKIILSGSSSMNLFDKFAEPLTGRNEKLYLTPLLFSEAVKTQSWYIDDPDVAKSPENFIEQKVAFLNKLLIYGSYPESLTTTNPVKYLQNLSADYLLRDVLNEGLIRSESIIKKLLLNLSYQISSEVSTLELATNIGVSRQTINKYLDILEKMFIVFRLPGFSSNPRKEVNKSQKIYFWDLGVRNALINDFSEVETRGDRGAIWENFVVSEFQKKNLSLGEGNKLHFWRQMGGGEVDLVVKSPDKLQAYEIKWSKDKIKTPKAFTNLYPEVGVKLINRNNFLCNSVN